MRSILLSLALIGSASQSVALSCIQPSVEQAFQWASESEDLYLPVLGRFEDLNITAGPVKDGIPSDSHGSARFVGRVVATRGFGQSLDRDVAVTLNCLANWCGRISDGVEILTFLQLDGPDTRFDVGPCGGSAFYNPKPGDVSAMRRCLRGGSCEPLD